MPAFVLPHFGEAIFALRVAPSEDWCAREDLNLQPFRDQILSLARLPFRHARVTTIKLRPARRNLKPGFSGSH